jgi:uncharacterized protein (DUF1330 family)
VSIVARRFLVSAFPGADGGRGRSSGYVIPLQSATARYPPLAERISGGERIPSDRAEFKSGHYTGTSTSLWQGVATMSSNTSKSYIEPSQDAGRAFVMRHISGSIVMLNLLRFREVADYSATPDLAPAVSISGAAAYQKYIEHALPYLRESGGDLLFLGSGGPFLIGPESERWDMVMLVRQQSVDAFLAFASHEAYLAGIGHRTAALEDSRLLPLTQIEATQ